MFLVNVFKRLNLNLKFKGCANSICLKGNKIKVRKSHHFVMKQPHNFRSKYIAQRSISLYNFRWVFKLSISFQSRFDCWSFSFFISWIAYECVTSATLFFAFFPSLVWIFQGYCHIIKMKMLITIHHRSILCRKRDSYCQYSAQRKLQHVICFQNQPNETEEKKNTNQNKLLTERRVAHVTCD